MKPLNLTVFVNDFESLLYILLCSLFISLLQFLGYIVGPYHGPTFMQVIGAIKFRKQVVKNDINLSSHIVKSTSFRGKQLRNTVLRVL